MWARLIYRFESMTEMINGAFMDDLGELLSSVTGNQRKTLYEIDQEFEKMCEMLLKNFATIKSLMPFLKPEADDDSQAEKGGERQGSMEESRGVLDATPG